MGFETITLGSNYRRKTKHGLVKISEEKIIAAAQKAIHLLTNKEERDRITQKNYHIGMEKFSITALREYLKPLVSRL